MRRTLLSLVCFFILSSMCFGQRYWVGLVSTDWGNTGNWATSPGGSGGATVPGSSDLVFFDRVTPNACVLSTAASITQFQMTNGSLSLGSASAALTVTSTFNMSGGTFSAGSGTLSVTSNTFTLSGGTLNGGSSTINIGNNMTVPSPGSFVPGTSTVVFNGNNQQDVVIVSGSTAGTFIFYNLTVNKPGDNIIRFTSTVPDTFQVNNLLHLSAGRFQGSGFVKIEKDILSEPAFSGSGIPVACTGPNPSIITLNAPLAVTGVTNFVGIAKSSPTATVSVFRGPGAADDTIRIGNFDSRFIVRRGIIQFPGNPPILSRFRTFEIEPEGTFISTSNYLYHGGEHINTGGVFNANNGTYVFFSSVNPHRTQLTNNKETFNNLIIDTQNQFGPGDNDTLVVNGTLTFRSGELHGNPGSAFNAKSNMIFESGAMQTFGVTNMIFSGTIDQSLTFGAGKESAWNGSVTINKPSGKLILQSPMIMDEFGGRTFTFTKGIVETTTANYLQFKNGTLAAGASNDSYVDGPVQHQWFGEFIFPIGDGGFYAPVRITESSNDIITAQYFRTDPNPLYNTASFSPPLQNISRKEYWMISKTGTATSPYIWLSYENVRSGGVTNPADLRVVRWNGSAWNNEGNAEAFSNFIRTTNKIASFSPFTLGSVNSTTNPLPVHFASFTARLVSGNALLEWRTENEINNSHFNIQRSTNGIQFDNIGRVAAQQGGQNNYHYSFTDNNIPAGRMYYRLQQVDIDGAFLYSRILMLSKSGEEDQLKVYPNPATSSTTLQCLSLAGKQVTIEILDAKGSVVRKQSIQLDGIGRWNLSSLPAKGTYIIRLINDDAKYQQTLIVQ